MLSPLRLVTIVAANDPLRDSLFAFTRALPSSQWWKQVAAPYGISTTATAVTVTGPAIASGTNFAFNELTTYVQRAAIDSGGYRPDGHTLYLIYLPPGVVCTTGSSCSIYPAFHVAFGSSDALAVVTRSQSGFVPTMELTTVTASHEIIEAATDPLLNAWRLVGASLLPWNASPWALDDGGNFEENGDMCQGTRYLEGGFYYQRIFSNQAAVIGGDPCVPFIATPYYNVAPDKSWYATTTGEVTVPLTGWSVGAVPDWVIGVGAGPHSASAAAPSLSLSCPNTMKINGTLFCALNNGRTAMLHVTLPPGSLSKTYFTVQVASLRFGANGERLVAGEDYSHRWIFGVYVP
jgi:hypothetical protein